MSDKPGGAKSIEATIAAVRQLGERAEAAHRATLLAIQQSALVGEEYRRLHRTWTPRRESVPFVRPMR